MITYNEDETRTRCELLRKPFLKLLIVSPTLVVGLAGNLSEFTNALYRLIYDSAEDVDQMLAELRDRSSQYPESFIVGSLAPKPTLWRIRDGRTVRTDKPGRCVIGDQESYALYMEREERCKSSGSVELDEAQALRMIIQYFANIDNGETRRSASEKASIHEFLGDGVGEFDRVIGGFLTEVATTPSGFVYEPHTQWIMPDRMKYRMEVNEPPDRVRLIARVESPMSHFRCTLAGIISNRRAVGFFLPEARVGMFYPDGEPWAPKEITTLHQSGEMVRAVWPEKKQVLFGWREAYWQGNFFPASIDDFGS